MINRDARALCGYFLIESSQCAANFRFCVQARLLGLSRQRKLLPPKSMANYSLSGDHHWVYEIRQVTWVS
jgi:hypothetical protein